MDTQDDGMKAVVTLRLAGAELFALDQLANLSGESRSDTIRRAVAECMRRTMREHKEWPLHPAWTDVGDDRWVMSNFQHWAYAVAAPDPGVYLEQVKLDGVSGFRWRKGRPTPKLQDWKEHVARYNARKGKESK
jgi:hypothetical protein